MITYYKIPKALAEKLELTEYRVGNADYGYIVNEGDFSAIGTEEAIKRGAEKLTEAEALKIVNLINKK